MPLHSRRALVLAALLVPVLKQAAAQPASAPPVTADLPLFAIEIKVGPKWDQSRPPQEQAFFKEHSANLRRMRESGVLVMGARYSDKGLVVVAASTAADARAQMEQDPSIAAGTFVFEVHPFSVFYSGELKPRSRRQTVQPNPSLKLTRYGMRCKPGPRYPVHSREPGLQRMPPRAA
jgi:uncharacterized protein YciI